MSELTVTLPEDIGRFVAAQVSLGRYHSADEVLQAALRLLKAQADLQKDIDLGWEQIERGESVRMNADEFLARRRDSGP